MSPKQLILRIYDVAIDSIVVVLVLVMLVTLCFSLVEVVANVAHLMPTLAAARVNDPEFRQMVGNVLDVFIMIELFSTFVLYVRTRHIRLSMLTDVTIVFLLREILIKVYAESWVPAQLYGLAGILLILIVARTILARLPPVDAGHGS